MPKKIFINGSVPWAGKDWETLCYVNEPQPKDKYEVSLKESTYLKGKGRVLCSIPKISVVLFLNFKILA